MNLYRVKFQLRGPYATPWLADTLYGHLCWAALRRGGQSRLDDILVPALEGQPAFVLSDGFPGDLLPMPVLPPPPIDPTADLATQRQRRDEEKRRRRAAWVTAQEFSRLLQGELVTPAPLPRDSTPVGRGILKNQINRLTSTTPEEGGLFEFEETFQKEVTVYALVEPDFVDRLRELLGYLAESGYGKKKATGYGSIKEMSDLELFPGFGSPSQPNGFVALSSFVPARHDPTRGYWQVLVKYGKLGEELASSDNPFKRPLLMFRAGATFYDSPVREFYGRLVGDISPAYDWVYQPAFCLAVPMLLPPEGAAL